MRIGIQGWGSEGDIRPLLALGHGLVRRGHHVELVYTDIAERRYEAVAAALGFTARAIATPVIPDRAELYRVGEQIINTRDPVRQGMIIIDRLLKPAEPAIFDAAVDLCSRSDVVVRHLVLHHVAAAAELARIPEVSVSFAHGLVPTRHILPQGVPPLVTSTAFNAVFWRIARWTLNLLNLRGINRFRAQHGLAPVRDVLLDAWASHRLNLIAVSPALSAQFDDWPPWNRVCGFLALPPTEHERIEPGLERFLSDGPPPVFLGFGSLMPLQSSQLTETVALLREAVVRAGCRAIIQADMQAEPHERVITVTRAPHGQVFPRCAAVVHHCGAGTTHTTLKAGVPSVPVPHVSDQFGWSSELRRLGVARGEVKRRSLTAKKLAALIGATIDDESLRRNAQAVSRCMATDDGPATGAALIERAAGTALDSSR